MIFGGRRGDDAGRQENMDGADAGFRLPRGAQDLGRVAHRRNRQAEIDDRAKRSRRRLDDHRRLLADELRQNGIVLQDGEDSQDREEYADDRRERDPGSPEDRHSSITPPSPKVHTPKIHQAPRLFRLGPFDDPPPAKNVPSLPAGESAMTATRRRSGRNSPAELRGSIRFAA